MTEILTADNLVDLSRIRHAFFTKAWGNGGFSRDIDEAHANRAVMARALGVTPQNLISCYQIHSPDVVTVTENWSAENRPKADAMVTDRPGIALGVLTADCVPILFASPQAGIIGAAHAGWRGALSGIIENTIAAMEKLGTSRSSIYAALGPCIWQKSYQVGPEFLAPFLAENPENKRFFASSLKSDRYQFDLSGYVVAKLKSLGLASVGLSVADTCADPDRFFSHRYSTLKAEERQGNLMSAIVVEKR